MSDTPSKAEKLAHNAILTLIARAAMGVLALLFVPAVVALFSMSANIERLAAANAQLKVELAAANVQLRTDFSARMDAAEARINQRLLPIENRQSGQTDRLRDHDAKFESITKDVQTLTVQVAVLVERITKLIDANPPRQGGPR